MLVYKPCRIVYAIFLFASCVIITSAKIYERCDLARELHVRHKIPMSQIATWVCIARHESEYNTAAVNHGSGDHGLFQISNLFWCSPPGAGHACGLSCSDLEDDDIEDDIICAKRIHREHTRLSGDGFNAWVVYGSHCKGQDLNKYIDGCFKDDKILQQFNLVDKQIETKQYYPTTQKIVPTTYRKVYPKTSVPTTSANPFIYQSRFAKLTYYSRPSTSTQNYKFSTTEVPTTTRRISFKSARNNIYNTDKHKSIEHSTGSRYKYHINKSDAHIILSFPHFLWADQSYKDSVIGLSPSESKHMTSALIEPNTGTPLSGSKRVQFNMFVRNIEGISFLDHYKKPVLMPIIWLDEHVDITPKLYDVLYDSYISKTYLIEGVTWGIIALGIVVVIATVAIHLWKTKKAKQTV